MATACGRPGLLLCVKGGGHRKQTGNTSLSPSDLIFPSKSWACTTQKLRKLNLDFMDVKGDYEFS
jgi:hypothetical protein